MERPTKLRVVLDTNDLISFLITPAGRAAAVVAAGLQESRYEAVTCPTIVEEIRRVCGYPKIAHRYGISDEDAEVLVALLYSKAVITPGLLEASGCEDPSDNRVLACALEGQAQCIVTGDPHLLALREYEGIRICNPSEMLNILS